MVILAMFVMFWRDMFPELYLVGKILFGIIVGACNLIALPLCIFEFVVIDIWSLLLAALSRDTTVAEMFEFYLGE